MIHENLKDEFTRITNVFRAQGVLSTGFEWGGYVVQFMRKDFYNEQHYKKIPYPENGFNK